MDESFKKLDTDTEISKGTVVSLQPLLVRLSDLDSIVQSLMAGQMRELFNQQLLKEQKRTIQHSSSSSLFYQDGISCEMLQPGSSGWKKGKLRVKAYLEFEPDESEVDATISTSENSQCAEIEFPLDEVRKAIADSI